MTTPLSRLDWPDGVEEARARLVQDPLSPEAAAQLEAALRTSGDPALAALRDLCCAVGGPDAPHEAPPPLGIADPDRLDGLVLHPREKEERRHRFASLFGRVLHALEGDPTVRTIVGVTEKATPAAFPRLCRTVAECACWMRVQPPDVRIARGEEKPFGVLVDREPFLYVHKEYAEDGPLSAAELRFAVARQLQHVRGGHAALVQLSGARLEALVLNEVPFLIRAPVKVATKAVGWLRLRAAVKKIAGWLKPKSRRRQVVDTVGAFLPGKDQETVVPEIVQRWLWSWLHGVEFSADRAGLLACGSVSAACSAVVCFSDALALHGAEARRRGLRWLLAEHGAADRTTGERLGELLRFGLSDEYLGYLQERASSPCVTGSP